jgi:apolipoprotein N-acyltransferase
MTTVIKKHFHNPFLLAIASGILLFAAWPMSPFTFLIFFAFIPLLYLSNLPIGKWKYFGLVYTSMFIWNISTTWWIWFASPPGAIGAFIANSLLMTFPWLLYRMVKKRLNKILSYIALTAFWMNWEYTHLQDWGLSWPWLTVGNVFATKPSWIQWYSYTGVAGGTLLVLLINILLYHFFVKTTPKKLHIKLSLTLVFILLILGYLSNLYKFMPVDKKNNIVICQPNIDPYQKLSEGTYATQLKTLITTSATKVDSNTVLLVWPETALYNEFRFDENSINGNHQLDSLYTFLKQYPKLQLFTGIESYKYFDTPTANSRNFPNTNIHFESYNSSVLIDKDGAKQYYHKSMLVPGVETLPSFLNFMGKWFEDFGGTTNGYVKQEQRTPINTDTYLKLAPSICYESIYGGFMSQYIKNGGNIITIITNDGWWQNTPGHRQHFAYASLRAIENSCWVVRSANTGISGFISPSGEVLDALEYGKQGALKMEFPTLRLHKTFYTEHPDLLYKTAVVMMLLLYGFYCFRILFTKSI